jgi:hypothetical protein
VDIQTVLDKYGLNAAIVLIMLTNVLPKLIEAGKWVIDKLAPERIQRMQLAAEESERRDERAQENEQFERDLRERDIIAKEQTAKALLLIDSHMESANRDIKDQLTLVTTGLITANQSLAVLIDRRRQSDQSLHSADLVS